MQCHLQAVNLTTNMKVKIYFTSPAFIATKTVTWEYHMGGLDKGILNMVLGRYLLTELLLNIKIYKHVIKSGDGPLKGSIAPMLDLGTPKFTVLYHKYKESDLSKLIKINAST